MVFDGLAIYNTIKQTKLKTRTFIDGLAASIASVVALAADEVVMGGNALFMIHEPWSMAIGSAEDMRKEAEVLDKVEGSILGTYVDASGGDEAEIKAWMEAETWMSAQEALDAGFVDRIYESEDVEDSARMDIFDLSIFNNAPEKEVNPRDLEKVLRDAGASRSQAKVIVSQAKEIMAKEQEPEPERDAPEPVVVPLREAEMPETNDLLIKLKSISA